MDAALAAVRRVECIEEHLDDVCAWRLAMRLPWTPKRAMRQAARMLLRPTPRRRRHLCAHCPQQTLTELVSMSSLLEWALALPSQHGGVPMPFLPGMTVTTLVASKNNIDALFSLLSRIDSSRYAKVLNEKDAYGNTSLHYFALSKNREAMRALVHLGASLDVSNNAAEIPQDVCRSGSLEFVMT